MLRYLRIKLYSNEHNEMHNYDMPKDAMIVFTEIGYSTFKEKLSNGLDAVFYLCFNSDTLWVI